MKTLLRNSWKIISLLLILTGNIASTSAQTNEGKTYLSNEVNINGLTIKIDPRIELLYSVGCIGGYPYMNRWDISYKEEVKNHFSGYQDHKVLNLWREIGPKGFALDGPVFHVIRQIKDLDEREKTPEGASENVVAENDYDKFTRLLKEFAEVSDFKSFYNRHRDFYNLILKNSDFNFKDYNEIQRMEKYFGHKQNSYTVIINLMGSGNFAPRVETPSGLDIYCVMEPQACCSNIPAFINQLKFDYIVLHEFSHSFVNPIVDEYKEEVNKYENLLEPIKNSMRNQGYSNWNTTVKEHIVRAVTIRLGAENYGEDLMSLTYCKLETGAQFIYAKALCEKLKEYEKKRDKYHTFKDFFPELISVFGDINENDIAEWKQYAEDVRWPDVKSISNPMNGYDKESTILIKPTNEKNDAQQEKLYQGIEQYKSWFYPNVKILSDWEALKSDLTKYDLIVFGTPSGNLFLEKHINHLPIIMKDGQVIADKVYRGNGYQLIAGWINPLNQDRKMTIYTAQNIELLNNINQVSLGDSNYVIAKNNQPVKYGNFERIMKIWICELD